LHFKEVRENANPDILAKEQAAGQPYANLCVESSHGVTRHDIQFRKTMRWPFFEAWFLLRDPVLDSRINKNPLPEDVRKQLPGLELGELKRFPTRVRLFYIFLSRLRFLLQTSRDIKRAQKQLVRAAALQKRAMKLDWSVLFFFRFFFLFGQMPLLLKRRLRRKLVGVTCFLFQPPQSLLSSLAWSSLLRE
jgi:hypothetical protein